MEYTYRTDEHGVTHKEEAEERFSVSCHQCGKSGNMHSFDLIAPGLVARFCKECHERSEEEFNAKDNMVE